MVLVDINQGWRASWPLEIASERVEADLKIDLISVCAMVVAIYPMSFSRLPEKKNWDIVFSNKTKFKTINELLLFLLTFQISKFLWRTSTSTA